MNVRLEKHFFLDFKTDFADQGGFIRSLSQHVEEDKEVGFAGYSRLEQLEPILKNQIFGFDVSMPDLNSSTFDVGKISEVIDRAIGDCTKILPTQNTTHVYIFPTFMDFVKQKMHGVTGWCGWKNAIIVFINTVSGWEEMLYETLVHEYNHSIAQEIILADPEFKWRTLEQVVHEGMTENYVETVLNKKPFISGAISEQEANAIFEKAKFKFLEVDKDFSRKLFFGSDDYQVWAGYGLGYWVVKSFRNKNPNIEWKDLVKISYQNIYEQSGFGADSIS